MDEHNPPFIMKNNQVFSKNVKKNEDLFKGRETKLRNMFEICCYFDAQGVERMKAEKQSTCPITGEEINWDEARKIFLC